MANEQLDSFLAEGAPDSAPAPTAPEPAAPAPASTPPPSDAKAPPSKAAPATTTPEPEDDEDFEPARDGEVLVPRRALEKERSKRQNWVERAARAEAERDALNKRLEEATQRAQAPPPQPVYQAPIDPVADPQGFLQRVRNEMLNERLNNSEQMLRREVGAEKVDAAIDEFKRAAQDDPALFQKLYAQPDPYGWAYKQVEKLRLLRDVGDDPQTFRERVIAEERAKWEAEHAARTVTISPAAGMQPSLAGQRSVAGRSAPQWSGEPSLDDVVASIQNRKKRQG